jgi:hypothetical protein
MTPMNNGEAWTAAAVTELIALVHEHGLNNVEIAQRTNRTVSAVSTAISRYAVRVPGAKLRRCMPCEKPFFSTHVGNRICGMCVKNLELECA